MMNVELARQILLDVEFIRDHEHWVFNVDYIDEHAFALQISIRTEDTAVLRCRRWLLDRTMTAGEIVQAAFMAVLAAQEHEAREFFRFKGRAIFGPHQDIDKLWELS